MKGTRHSKGSIPKTCENLSITSAKTPRLTSSRTWLTAAWDHTSASLRSAAVRVPPSMGRYCGPVTGGHSACALMRY